MTGCKPTGQNSKIGIRSIWRAFRAFFPRFAFSQWTASGARESGSYQLPGLGINIWQTAGFTPFEGRAGMIIHFLDNLQFAPERERQEFAVLPEAASLPCGEAPIDI
jgi:hypothetical protein